MIVLVSLTLCFRYAGSKQYKCNIVKCCDGYSHVDYMLLTSRVFFIYLPHLHLRICIIFVLFNRSQNSPFSFPYCVPCFFVFFRNGINKSTPEAHKAFMEKYKQMFVDTKPKIGLPVHSLQRR